MDMFSPKDTAIELINKYRPLVYPYLGSGFMTGTEDESVIIQNAKTCALICVNQILENIDDGFEFTLAEKINYWTAVEYEISKL